MNRYINILTGRENSFKKIEFTVSTIAWGLLGRLYIIAKLN